MKLSEYLSAGSGRAQALAEAIKASPVLVSQWRNGVRPVPIERCVSIERATGGAVTRCDLRDDWLDHWPELAGTEQAR